MQGSSMSTTRKRPGPQKRGQKPGSRGQPKPKRRQGGKGKPFQPGQPDLPGAGTRFQPGESGNPGGRPKTLKELKERIQRRGGDLIDILFGIAEGLPERAGTRVVGPSHADRYHCAKELLDRGYGRTLQAVELTGKGGGPLEARDISELNSAERRARLRDLLAKAAVKAAAATTAAPAEGDEGDDGGTVGV
jgi:hypothetical protein